MFSSARRRFLSNLSQGMALAGVASRTFASSSSAFSGQVQGSSSLSGLRPLSYTPLPLGSILAEGWLKRQLRIQADGLSGHLDEFWPDVGQSQWFGGKAEGWERAPYWLDGVIPLAWVLDDQPLKAKVSRYVEQIVNGQRSDGWYGPYPSDAGAKPYDIWAIFLANKMLVQYHQATSDNRVLEAVIRNLRACLQALDRTPLFEWGKFRWFEGLIAAFYAYEKTGEPWLLDLSRKLQAQGYDYMSFFAEDDLCTPTPRRGQWKWNKHVVNMAMTPKAYALSWRLTGKESELAFPAKMLEILDRWHGQITGMFTGDECLSGKNPIQGTELCAVVELLYSLEWLLAITGEAHFGDRLERIAYNALPATFAPDMWSHQYDQQVNQVQCTVNPEHLWSTNGPESNLYGLEPNFGCCTANMHQGWPKLAAHLWMRSPDRGLAAMAYAPSTVRLRIGDQPVQAKMETDYPFRDTVKLTVRTEKVMRFPLWMRVPAWAEGAVIRVAGGAEERLNPGGFHRLEREWRDTTEIQLRFPMKPRAVRGYNGSIAVERGPLVYSLQIGEEWKQVNSDKPYRQLPHGDFEVRPVTPWNYGLLLDETNPEAGLRFEEKPIGERPFSPEGAGVTAKAQGRRLPKWKLVRGWAAENPVGEQESSEPLEELTLVPYGCTNIRITEFPKLVR